METPVIHEGEEISPLTQTAVRQDFVKFRSRMSIHLFRVLDCNISS